MKKKTKLLITLLLALIVFLFIYDPFTSGIPDAVRTAEKSTFELCVRYVTPHSVSQYPIGTAFVIYRDAEKTLLATCAHCVEEDPEQPGITLTVGNTQFEQNKPDVSYRVYCNNKDYKEYYDAEIIYISDEYDVAVLQINADCGFDAIPITEATLFSRVYAIGYPGEPEQSALLSYDQELGRTISGGHLTFLLFPDFLMPDHNEKNNQTFIHTARTFHGNSGGPLVNTRGEVVGINCCTVGNFFEKTDSDYHLSGSLGGITLSRIFKENDIPFTRHVSRDVVINIIVIIAFIITLLWSGRKNAETANT